MSAAASSARYYRLKPRLGAQRALMAIMRQLLKVIYHLLKKGQPYREVGTDSYQTADPARHRSSHEAARTPGLPLDSGSRIGGLTRPSCYFTRDHKLTGAV